MSESGHFSYECGDKANAKLDVVFIHGLTGHPHETWTSTNANGTTCFWPYWLSEDISNVCVWTAGYPSSLFEKVSRKEMDMHERATSLLELFAGEGLGTRPLAFVCHSLGGLIAKELLRAATESRDEDLNGIADNTKLVAFLATPHKAPGLAKALKFALPRLSSKYINVLADDTGFLSNLFDSYRNLAAKNEITTLAYYEKHKTKGVVTVVTRDNADPGELSFNPVAIDANHAEICKPSSRNEQPYISLKRQIKKVVVSLQNDDDDDDEDSVHDNEPAASVSFFYLSVRESRERGTAHLALGIENYGTQNTLLRSLRFNIENWIALIEHMPTESFRVSPPTVPPILQLSIVNPARYYEYFFRCTEQTNNSYEVEELQSGRAKHLRLNLFSKEAPTDLPNLQVSRVEELVNRNSFEKDPVLGIFIVKIRCCIVLADGQEADPFFFLTTLGGGLSKTEIQVPHPLLVNESGQTVTNEAIFELFKGCKVVGNLILNDLGSRIYPNEKFEHTWTNSASRHADY